MSEIPRIEIREVNIPKIPIWELYVPTLDVIYKPKVDIPGCVRVHRNNLPSLIDSDKDEYGTYSECGNFIIPSFEPLQYNPNEFTYTESATPNKHCDKCHNPGTHHLVDIDSNNPNYKKCQANICKCHPPGELEPIGCAKLSFVSGKFPVKVPPLALMFPLAVTLPVISIPPVAVSNFLLPA